MKNVFIIIIISICISIVWGQDKKTAVNPTDSSSGKGITIKGLDTLAIIPPVENPPVLEISDITLIGVENANRLSADETKGYLRFKIKNTGEDNAYNLRLYITETSGVGLTYRNFKFIDKKFKPGETRVDSISVAGGKNLRDGKAQFEFKLIEANGYQSQIAMASFFTRQSSFRNIDLITYDVPDLSEKGGELTITMTVKNTGSSNIRDGKVSISYPETFYPKGNNEKNLPALQPDESAEIDFVFVTNNKFNILYKSEFTAKFEDAKGNPLGKSRNLTRSGSDYVPVGGELSDVDINIPLSPYEEKNTGTYVLIIGNENYHSHMKVPYAKNDANIFSVYCIKTFNIPKENIIVVTDATGNQMKERIGELARRALYHKEGKAELIVYYSGHGIMDKDKDSLNDNDFIQYLVPVDVMGVNSSLCISRNEIYKALNDVPYSRLSLFLDACNIPGNRAIGKIAKSEWKGEAFVFASSSEKETSGTYHEKKHGIFTYFILKNIQAKPAVNFADLTEKVTSEVKVQSNKMGKLQNPSIGFSPEAKESWKKWKFLR